MMTSVTFCESLLRPSRDAWGLFLSALLLTGAAPSVRGTLPVSSRTAAAPFAMHWVTARLVLDGRPVVTLAASDDRALALRFAEIRARLRAAISRDGTIRTPGPLQATTGVAGILFALGPDPLLTVTPLDARRSGVAPAQARVDVDSSLTAYLQRLPVGEAWSEASCTLMDEHGQPWKPTLLAQAVREVGELVPIGVPGVRASLHGHILRLTGAVPTLETKVVLARDARNLPGVRDVENLLVVAGADADAPFPPEAALLPGAAPVPSEASAEARP